MAQANKEILVVPSSPGNGAGLPVGRYTFKSVHLQVGTGSPDYDLEMSFDNEVTWVSHTTGIGVDTVITTEDPANPLPKAISHLRIVRVAGTGDPSATLFGHDPV